MTIQLINYSTFPSFTAKLVSCLSFTRAGGVSPAPYNSLNASHGVGDDPQNVDKNRQLILSSSNLNILISAKQVHGERVKSITNLPHSNIEFSEYDALITNLPGIGLMIQQADCQAVMLYDPVKKVVANVHSGWRGSVLNIIEKTIGQMSQDFGTKPKNLHAVISPSLGPCCAEFVNYNTELPAYFHSYQVKSNYFDFWQISSDQLVGAGLDPANIYNKKICTVCDDRFFSYRRDGVTGRCASVIGIKQ